MFAAYGCVFDFARHCVRVDDVLEGLITLRCVIGSCVFDLLVVSTLGVVDLQQYIVVGRQRTLYKKVENHNRIPGWYRPGCLSLVWCDGYARWLWIKILFWKRTAAGRVSPSVPRTVEVARTMLAPHAHDWHRLGHGGNRHRRNHDTRVSCRYNCQGLCVGISGSDRPYHFPLLQEVT